VKVLVVHNPYQLRGGEDAVFEDEVQLLRQQGHEVQTFTRNNADINTQSALTSAAEALWSRRSAAQVSQIIETWAPDLMHVHNTFALVSPAVLWAAQRRGVAVVATLHNFRLACLEGTFLREGKPCRDCLGKLPLLGIQRACYRGSRAQSMVLASSLVLHRALGSWRQRVNRFIALNDAAVDTYAAMGLPRHKFRVKPNFAWEPAPTCGEAPRMGGLFVGRLSAEKGVAVLANALSLLPELRGDNPLFTIVGTGPELSTLQTSGAQLMGQLPAKLVQEQMQRAQFLVLPSLAQEQFPKVLAEAFAVGLPIIAAAHGPLATLVEDGYTGLHFKSGDAADLAAKIAWAYAHPDRMQQMGQQALQRYAAHYSPQAVYQMQLQIYEEAVAEAKGLSSQHT
jgi:glycosyltransferase involved in cell wall biosynthesis